MKLVYALLLLSLTACSSFVCPSTLKHVEGAYAGEGFSFLLPANGNLAPVQARVYEFENCTGAKIWTTPVPYNEWASNLKSALGTSKGSGTQLYDCLLIKSAWFAHYAFLGSLEPLSEYIQTRGQHLDWPDTLPVVRRNLVTYDNTVYVMANDADFVQLYYRQDLFAREKLSLPHTWEDLIHIAEVFNGTDLNNDTTPDYGICWPANEFNFAMIAMSIHATTMQGGGVDQGFFFDLLTGMPLWNTSAAAYAFGIMEKLFSMSPFVKHGPNHHNFKGHATDFRNGRCALLAGMPGLFKALMFKDYTVDANGRRVLQPTVRRVDADGTVVWAPDQPPRHLRMVGSERVLDENSGELRNCTREICLYAAGVPMINRPAFFGSGGFASAIAESAPQRKKDIAWDFLVYLNAKEQSTVDVASPGFLDPYRTSHISEDALPVYEAQGWDRQRAQWLFEVESIALLGQVEDTAMDLRIPYREDFIFETNLPSKRETLYLEPQGWEYINYKWLGWAKDPDGDWVRVDRYNGTDAERIAVLQHQLTDAWLSTMRRRGGVLSILESYRESLSQPALTEAQLCEYHKAEYEARGHTCGLADIVPCGISGCGKWAECVDPSGPCTCTNGDTVPAPDFAESKRCVQRVASTSQQRVFWTLSGFLHFAGFILSVRVMWEFWFNSRLQPPYTLMQSFLAIFVPDLAYSTVYFFFQITNLLRGSEIPSAPCDAIAFMTFGIVIATFCGPVIVAAVTYLKLKRLAQGDVAWSISWPMLALILAVPWLLGIAFALIVQQTGYLGSYRGLYCYAYTWEEFVTGGLTMLTFLLSTSLTVFFYVLAVLYVRRTMVAAKQHNAARKASRTVALRGLVLVCAYFLTWILWTGVGFSAFLGSVPSIPLETVAALITSCQPIVDALILLNTPVVKGSMYRRLLSQVAEGADLRSDRCSSATNKTGAEAGQQTHASITSGDSPTSSRPPALSQSLTGTSRLLPAAVADEDGSDRPTLVRRHTAACDSIKETASVRETASLLNGPEVQIKNVLA